ncbi:MAG: hypothetical protein M3458_08315 [Acidobacteriota bacterium]|nr:hypothetical protein [Acidobacteriota bacterium]
MSPLSQSAVACHAAGCAGSGGDHHHHHSTTSVTSKNKVQSGQDFRAANQRFGGDFGQRCVGGDLTERRGEWSGERRIDVD